MPETPLTANTRFPKSPSVASSSTKHVTGPPAAERGAALGRNQIQRPLLGASKTRELTVDRSYNGHPIYDGGNVGKLAQIGRSACERE